jgi:hypothetical protein
MWGGGFCGDGAETLPGVLRSAGVTSRMWRLPRRTTLVGAVTRGRGSGPRQIHCEATRKSSPMLGRGSRGAVKLGKVGSGRKGGATRCGLKSSRDPLVTKTVAQRVSAKEEPR